MEEFCDQHCNKSCYQLTYGDIIYPIPDLSIVDIRENPEDVILPPVLRRLPRRPRKNRRREPGQGLSSARTAKRSAIVR